jgi:hypothetical protein
LLAGGLGSSQGGANEKATSDGGHSGVGPADAWKSGQREKKHISETAANQKWEAGPEHLENGQKEESGRKMDFLEHQGEMKEEKMPRTTVQPADKGRQKSSGAIQHNLR